MFLKGLVLAQVDLISGLCDLGNAWRSPAKKLRNDDTENHFDAHSGVRPASRGKPEPNKPTVAKHLIDVKQNANKL